MSATPLPVSIALAGHTNDRVVRKVTATPMTAVVRIAARICGTLTWKCRPTWPRTWIVMTTAATCNRGSRSFGRMTGYVFPPMCSALVDGTVSTAPSGPATTCCVSTAVSAIAPQTSAMAARSLIVDSDDAFT